MFKDDCSILTNVPKRLLSFSLGSKVFYLDMKYLLTILIPETSKTLELQSSNNGIQIIYKKEIFPFINFDVILGSYSKRKNYSRYIILIEYDNKKAAFYADKIVEFTVLNEKILGILENAIASGGKELVHKVLYENKQITVINVGEVLELNKNRMYKLKGGNNKKNVEINVLSK